MEYGLYLIILVALAISLGHYIGKVMYGQRVFLSPLISPVEDCIYKFLKVDKNEDMNWKKYAVSVACFSITCLAILMSMLMLQDRLPFNTQSFKGLSWDLAFNTAVSFITNTNWQAYSGENTLGYFAQSIGLTVQNFVSAAIGISVLFALIRGFTRIKENGVGNLWVDITRSILYILLPICMIISIMLVSQGVVQNLKPYETVNLVEPIVTDSGQIVTEQIVPMGPQASQVAPKQLGTNGGGFNGTNSASPLENPTPLSNIIEMISILLIPAALCFSFGHCINDKKQGRAIFLAMFAVLCLALVIVATNEQMGTPQLIQNGQVDISSVSQSGGNMEGKESRFGIEASATWATFTTAASNGSVNSMHDSYTPLSGFVLMLLMQLGEVIFGGAGCGLYGMLGFALLTVFIAGLMVGRTPEYLGKKIEPFEMKMAAVMCLATPIAILAGSAIAAIHPDIFHSISNQGAHGFSQLLYAYSSCGGNNGSAFAGFDANTKFLNISLGIVMLFARFVPMIATLAIAGSMAQKKKIAMSAGTLSTSNLMFIFILIMVVLMIGALSFLPALAIGPIAEYFEMIS